MPPFTRVSKLSGSLQTLICMQAWIQGEEMHGQFSPPPLPAFIVRYTSQGISASNQLVQQPIKECDSVSCASKPHIKTPYINLQPQAAYLSSPSKFLDPPLVCFFYAMTVSQIQVNVNIDNSYSLFECFMHAFTRQ